MPPESHAVVVGLGGSLRSESHSLAALEVALDAAEHAGAKVQLYDVGALDLPLFAPGTVATEATQASPTPSSRRTG